MPNSALGLIGKGSADLMVPEKLVSRAGCLLVWENVGKADPPNESWSSGLTPASVREASREAASGSTRLPPEVDLKMASDATQRLVSI
jgi:hypothetical protein